MPARPTVMRLAGEDGLDVMKEDLVVARGVALRSLLRLSFGFQHG